MRGSDLANLWMLSPFGTQDMCHPCCNKCTWYADRHVRSASRTYHVTRYPTPGHAKYYVDGRAYIRLKIQKSESNTNRPGPLSHTQLPKTKLLKAKVSTIIMQPRKLKTQ